MAVKAFTIADKTVATAGTRVQIVSTSTFAFSVVIEAASTNTGNLYFGDKNVSSSRGVAISPAANISVSGRVSHHTTEDFDIKDMWLDTDTNGNKAKIVYLSTTD